ncbi:ankyrin repeat domain-containing protein [Aspergillus mulundensis]|uniref:Uncharacterized protein n=1 Tax=Aspergillus mulundensis TaxID=1810919 RepID=A0A3D8QUX7_9EURO|nr:hypothetical protein DSM5745_09402 [Aspergillus mulundensis]RDW65663.1 hypothetical protein DSM5745_09402 [Aspergillus mulundensis]
MATLETLLQTSTTFEEDERQHGHAKTIDQPRRLAARAYPPHLETELLRPHKKQAGPDLSCPLQPCESRTLPPRSNKVFDWAAGKGDEPALHRALSYHTPFRKTKPMFTAIEHAQYPIVQILLATPGVNIEARNHQGFTALEVAVRSGRGSIVKLLLDAGANTEPNTMFARYEGYLARIAARERFSDVLKHLIDSGRVDLKPQPRVSGRQLSLPRLTQSLRGMLSISSEPE